MFVQHLTLQKRFSGLFKINSLFLKKLTTLKKIVPRGKGPAGWLYNV